MPEGSEGAASCVSHRHIVSECLWVSTLSSWKGAPTLPQVRLGPGGPLHPYTTQVTFAVVFRGA